MAIKIRAYYQWPYNPITERNTIETSVNVIEMLEMLYKC